MDIQFSKYGQERELIATESELEIFDILKSLPKCGNLELVRKSDNYVTAVLCTWDLARFKYTPRAKWIQFPIIEPAKMKHSIETPSDVRQFMQQIRQSLSHIGIC